MDFEDIPEANEELPPAPAADFSSFEDEEVSEQPKQEIKGYAAFPDPEPEDALA